MSEPVGDLQSPQTLGAFTELSAQERSIWLSSNYLITVLHTKQITKITLWLFAQQQWQTAHSFVAAGGSPNGWGGRFVIGVVHSVGLSKIHATQGALRVLMISCSLNLVTHFWPPLSPMIPSCENTPYPLGIYTDPFVWKLKFIQINF